MCHIPLVIIYSLLYLISRILRDQAGFPQLMAETVLSKATATTDTDIHGEAAGKFSFVYGMPCAILIKKHTN